MGRIIHFEVVNGKLTFTRFVSDIRLDWELYNVEEADSKLLDLVVTFGQAFPLRDADGEEIIPQPAAGKV